jgi:hypothetical protein
MRNKNLDPTPRVQPFGDSKLSGRIVVLAGILVALILGIAVGLSDLRLGVMLLLLASGAFYIVVVRRATWQIALFLCFLQFVVSPGGSFSAGPIEQTCALGICLIVVQLWHKQAPAEAAFFRSNAFVFFRTTVFVWLLYTSGRFLWNFLFPFRPEEYDLNSLIKREFTVSGPFLMVWLFCLHPWKITVRRGFTETIATLLLVALFINLAIRLYGLKQGLLADDSPLSGDFSESSIITIPVINMNESPYVLRLIGVYAVLFGTILITSPRQREMSFRMRLVYGGLILGGFAGAAISGGRASVLAASVFCLGIVILRKKFFTLAILVLGLLTGFCLLNVFSQKIVTDPKLMVIERSFYWAMFQKPGASSAGGTIDASTQWRQELFHRSIDEWKSDPFIFWFGRSTYKFSEADRIAVEVNGEEGSLDSFLRLGATHNLLTSLLIIYGLVGFLIYGAFCLALIWLCWSIFKERNLPEDARDIGLISLILAIFAVILGFTAGPFVPVEIFWMVVILLGRMVSSWGSPNSRFIRGHLD